MKNDKQVIMTYEEHQLWIKEREQYQENIKLLTENAKKSNESYEKALKEKGVVYVEEGSVKIGTEWKSYGLGSGYYADVTIPYLRLVPEDAVLDRFDSSNQDLHREIIKLREEEEFLKHEAISSIRKYDAIKNNMKEFLDSIPKRFSKKHIKYFRI